MLTDRHDAQLLPLSCMRQTVNHAGLCCRCNAKLSKHHEAQSDLMLFTASTHLLCSNHHQSRLQHSSRSRGMLQGDMLHVCTPVIA